CRADQVILNGARYHGVERLADVHRHQRAAGGVADRADEQGQDKNLVAQDRIQGIFLSCEAA
ncbi:MAG: hypothetical protein O8C63_11890, partial [Candidatus Methanoperedens sp.]|nr:hypothetical protein [Candidatus Methanoperedens sp.]